MTLLWLGMWLPTLIGTFTIIMWLRPEKEDGVTDVSNRINRIRLWWFALTRRSMFVPVAEWLKHDEADNLTKS